MTQLLTMGKQFFNWMVSLVIGQSEEDCNCNCNWADEEQIELQESSGLGTVLIVSASLLGLFLTANMIPSQETQRPRSLREEEQRKQQQVRRITELLRNASYNSQKNVTDIEDWQDALPPSEEEQEEEQIATSTNNCSPTEQSFKQLHLKLAQSMLEVFHDAISQKSENDCYKDIQDE